MWLSGAELLKTYRFKARSYSRWRKNWLLRNSGIFDDDVIDFRLSNSKEYQNIARPKRPWLETPFKLRALARIMLMIGVFATLYLFCTKIYEWITDIVEGAAIDAMVLLYEIYKVTIDPITNDPVVQRVLGKGVQGEKI